MIWDLSEHAGESSIFLIHGIEEKRASYIAMHGDKLVRVGEVRDEVDACVLAQCCPLESVAPVGGGSFLKQWLQDRRLREDAQRIERGAIPWDDFNNGTIMWYAQRLDETAQTEGRARKTISNALLDGRSCFDTEEILQLRVLFGKEEVVRRVVGRKLLDCQAVSDPDNAWDARIECWVNVIETLRQAVMFVQDHTEIEEFTSDELVGRSGGPDYTIFREALLNLLIHQDYSDRRTEGQIRIGLERTTFFNAGVSLIPVDELYQGHKTQSRNPIISRALHLIGFAEIAGTGLLQLQRALSRSNRRPPSIRSDVGTNTFSLTLDWRALPDNTVAFWREKVGVALDDRGARVLALTREPSGAAANDVASHLGCQPDDAMSILRSLKRQGLVDEDGGRFYLANHLAAAIDGATSAGGA